MLALNVLILHGLIGGFDVVWNHELKERLPAQRWAAREQRLHSMREVLFAALFIGLAWWEWRGAFAWCVALVLATEFAVTARDAVLEVRTRVLSVAEQLCHVLLYVNFGAIVTLLGAPLMRWYQLPTALVAVDYGWRSRLLLLLGVVGLLWSVRDAVSAVALGRAAAPPEPAAHAGPL